MKDVFSRQRTHISVIDQWFRRHPVVGDSLLAAGIFVLSTTSFIVLQSSPLAMPPLWQTLLAIAFGCLPIVFRRIALWWSVGLSVAVMVAASAFPFVWVSFNNAIVVISYTAAARLSLRQSILANVAIWGTLTLLLGTVIKEAQLGMSPLAAMLLNYVFASVCFGIGRTVYNRRKTLNLLRERARLAEATQHAMAEQAVSEERHRIARELHDVVAHHISVMGVLATGARRVLHKNPQQADDTLATIETTGRATLREMRRLLHVLRTSEEPAESLTPQPSLDAVHTLVQQVRETGMPVSFTVDGKPYPLDPGIALTTYRIIQEGLTNSLKHAGKGARASVRVQYESSELRFETSDNGHGPKVASDGKVGHGLVGMKERVALYGGTLRAGPRPGGGFRVQASIPIDPPSTSEDNIQGAP